MTFDAIALVAHEPTTEALAKVLRELDPDLLLRLHDDSGVLEVLDAEGVRLAALEPGQLVSGTDEIARLLGEDMTAGLTAPCWWVEVRSRPDEAGRGMALQLVDGLALRLGGQVWTSGTGDFGLWEDSGPGEGEHGHPALERRRERALLIAQDREVVPLSSWVTDTIATQAENRIVQVVTPASARLTHGLRTFLTGPRGRWVVQRGEGEHFDGVTGLPLAWNEEHGFIPYRVAPDDEGNTRAETDGPPEAVQGFLDDDPLGTQLLLDLVVTHHDASVPGLGRAVRTMTEHLTGQPPTGWGPHEPVLHPWNPDQMRQFVLHQGPASSVLHFSGPQVGLRRFGGSVYYRWDGFKATERISLAVGFQDEGDVPFDVLPELVAALADEGLLDGLRVGRIRGRSDLTFESRWHQGSFKFPRGRVRS